jgi:hypothetical protein
MCICGWQHISSLDESNYVPMLTLTRIPYCPKCGKPARITSYLKKESIPDSEEVLKIKTGGQ